MSGRTSQKDRQFNFSFVDDPISRRVMRALFLIEVGGLIAVIAFSLRQTYRPAFAISLATLLILGLALIWLYARYQEFPVVREKKELEHLTHKFQKGILTEEKNIQAAVRLRGDLFLAEKAEIQAALGKLQKNHVDRGLLTATIQEASIQSMGPELKARLASQGITCAMDLAEKIAESGDLNDLDRQALTDWQSTLLATLESTKPTSLEEKELESIQRKYRTLQDQNNIANRKALASRQMLHYEVISFHERLQQITSFTFPRYLSRSLASSQFLAAPLAFALIMIQVASSVSAMAASIAVLIPVTGEALAPATIQSPPKLALPTKTPLPSSTATLPTAQLQPSTLPVQSSQTALSPASGNCDPSYPGVCIAPPPPDLDCSDVPDRRFQVLPPDPHGFDRDGDGIGCE